MHSQNPKHRQQYQQDIIYIHHEKDIGIRRRNFLQNRMLEWTKNFFTAISQVKLEDEAYHERIIEYLIQEDDDSSSPWKRDAVGLNEVTNSSDSGEITFKIPVKESYLDKILQQDKSQSKILQL